MSDRHESDTIEKTRKFYFMIKNNMDHLQKTDNEIYNLIKQEQERQQHKIRLIPSENYVSHAVLEATGSVLTNKYSEGYPGKRYYEGQQFIDKIENIAKERAETLFGMDHANVQPYSGSPANMAAYYALIKPGDTIMGMSLPHGGHLTHGWNVSFSARFYHAVQYTVDPKTHLLNYDAIRKMAKEHKPKVIVAGATAYPRKIDFNAFAEIANEVNAYFIADIAHLAGLIAGGAHESPAPVADVVTTTTHKTLRGPRGAMVLCKKKYAKALDRAVFPALQGGPHNHTTAAIAVALKEARTPEFSNYAAQIVKNARAFGEELQSLGFTLITGGTDNHLLLVDTMSKKIPGKVMSQALDKAGIVTNYNTIPFDTRPPFNPSGIRIGSPAVTSRGFDEDNMRQIATWMHEVAEHIDDEKVHHRIAQEVKELCLKHPAPGFEAQTLEKLSI